MEPLGKYMPEAFRHPGAAVARALAQLGRAASESPHSGPPLFLGGFEFSEFRIPVLPLHPTTLLGLGFGVSGSALGFWGLELLGIWAVLLRSALRLYRGVELQKRRDTDGVQDVGEVYYCRSAQD